MLRAATQEAFVWTTLQIEVGTVGRRPGAAGAVGTCISFQHGKNNGKVEVDNGSGMLPEPVVACAHDSSLDVQLAPFSGFHMVVTAMLLGTSDKLSNRDKTGLYELGFPGQSKTPDVCLAAPKLKHANRSVQEWAEFYEHNGVPEGDQIPTGKKSHMYRVV